ncbi:MAG TPA: toll/interleukin-1 receptor domain-containing protein, partial [Acidobacteriaceae bacterium]|nr:toll/interleukin-1 receptor domain-containing protein [Acidobacteriaceae bacterium]
MLFISHSSRDNTAALRVRDWLASQGWDEVFLDLDPLQGLAPGQRWQQELKRAGERCSGVLILISPAWVDSRWCQIEFVVAEQLGKKIFPVLIAPTPAGSLPPELPSNYQYADISTPEKESDGFARLAVGLKRAGLDPHSFPWPPPDEPHRPIYRGLESLDIQDAAIFFGRDNLITKGMDTLRRMRDGAPERMLIVVGASGAGKSSFLKAGLLARLKRDEPNFVVLPVVRPGRAALSGTQGLIAALGCEATQLDEPDGLAACFASARAAAARRHRPYAQTVDGDKRRKDPTLVVPIDQAEELFAPNHAEGQRTLRLLADALCADDNVIVVATIRSDAFATLQEEQSLARIPLIPFSLP